ncbi:MULTISPECIES: glycosyltransferase [unclassified Chelatococcus]|uniref:CgeB family protein n=1 Tax=unclassified Chelatococcus TaxID=2638111 RepID=UPI001BCC5CE5|nr:MULTISPECIES: glycosyltransferase [unclassified Chelatococcus]MBS7700041.1 glycosyltransferase [Chelatococcus sp. YT9]MBX3556734.1 glycosyltransferase [Chelatococcus sp.]
MKMAFYGSSLLSSYWNGAATYYRGLLRDLAGRGYEITFYEPDAFDRQQHRDIEPPEWADVVVYQPHEADLRRVIADARRADVVVKASGVGINDDALLEGVMAAAHPDAIRIFWDVDAPATLASLASAAGHGQLLGAGRLTSEPPAMSPEIIRRALPGLDLVLTYGGGPPVVRAYETFGAARCVPVYNALDPDTHYPVARDPRFSCDLAFLGNRLPDREERVTQFFLVPAARLRERTFLIGGNGWDDRAMPPNVRRMGHVYTRDHNAFNATPRAVLNIARSSMAETGYSPATRVFEAAGAGACLITDAWEGIELFLEPGREVLVARDGLDVAALLDDLSTERAEAIGKAALARVRAEHSYAHRGAQVDALLRETFAAKRERRLACVS